MQVINDNDDTISWVQYDNNDEVSGLVKSLGYIQKQGIEFPKLLFVDWTQNKVRIQNKVPNK